MTFESIIVLLIVGAVAGWLAGVIMKGYGHRRDHRRGDPALHHRPGAKIAAPRSAK